MSRFIAGIAATIVAGASARAGAHPAAAAPPEFPATACVTAVDKDAQATFDIDYSLTADDTTFGYADIPLPDAKTHQFFAFAGALSPDTLSYRLDPFQPADTESIEMPLWITVADVKRAASASGTVEGATITASDIPADTTLAENPALHGLWQRIQADQARVPITVAQARMGAHWDLGGVTPGVYSIAAYIFSPPYNGWAVRPGVVKVTDATHDMPAGTIASINDFVFAYQGRRVSACLDVPPGSVLDAYYIIEEHPEAGWKRWVEARDVSSGQLDLCFHDRTQQALSGSVRIRFDVTGPDGSVTTLHAPDTFTALNGQGDCVPSDTLCCDFEGAITGDEPADDDAGARPRPAPHARITMHDDADGGCSAAHAPRGLPLCSWPVAAATLALMRRRAHRRRSTTGSSRSARP